MDATNLDLYERVRCRVRLRRTWPVKPAAEPLDGRTILFQAGWIIEAEDSSIYVGERAMLIVDWSALVNEFRTEEVPSWIASGDLELVEGE